MCERAVTLVNRLGLHARAATEFIRVAGAYGAEISVVHRGRTVDGKSVMGVMTLGAPCGSDLTLRARGADAREALDALETLIAERFGEPD